MQTAMTVIAIDGGPRRNGTVATLVQEAARAAEASGAEVSRVRLYDLRIEWCKDCLVCRATGQCPVRDDLPDLARRICSADALIVGTPSYWGQPSAATKALFDRMVGYFATYELVDGRFKTTAHFKDKRAVIITACTANAPWAQLLGHSTGPLRLVRRMLNGGGIKTVGTLAATDTWRDPNKGDALRTRAADLGRKVVRASS